MIINTFMCVQEEGGRALKDKATFCFRRMKTGEVVGEIIYGDGEIMQARNFGVMTEMEFRKVLKIVQQEYPDVAPDEPIELTGN
jgi:hypothetical protein